MPKTESLCFTSKSINDSMIVATTNNPVEMIEKMTTPFLLKSSIKIPPENKSINCIGRDRPC